MKKYLFVYHFYSDGFTWLIIAKTTFQALLKLRREYSFYIFKDYLKIYEVDSLNVTQQL